MGKSLDGWSDVLCATINEVGWGSVDNLTKNKLFHFLKLLIGCKTLADKL